MNLYGVLGGLELGFLYNGIASAPLGPMIDMSSCISDRYERGISALHEIRERSGKEAESYIIAADHAERLSQYWQWRVRMGLRYAEITQLGGYLNSNQTDRGPIGVLDKMINGSVIKPLRTLLNWSAAANVSDAVGTYSKGVQAIKVTLAAIFSTVDLINLQDLEKDVSENQAWLENVTYLRLAQERLTEHHDRVSGLIATLEEAHRNHCVCNNPIGRN